MPVFCVITSETFHQLSTKVKPFFFLSSATWKPAEYFLDKARLDNQAAHGQRRTETIKPRLEATAKIQQELTGVFIVEGQQNKNPGVEQTAR